MLGGPTGDGIPSDATVTSTVGIGPRAAGGFGLEIALEVSLPGIARGDAEALVARAHEERGDDPCFPVLSSPSLRSNEGHD